MLPLLIIVEDNYTEHHSDFCNNRFYISSSIFPYLFPSGCWRKHHHYGPCIYQIFTYVVSYPVEAAVAMMYFYILILRYISRWDALCLSLRLEWTAVPNLNSFERYKLFMTIMCFFICSLPVFLPTRTTRCCQNGAWKSAIYHIQNTWDLSTTLFSAI